MGVAISSLVVFVSVAMHGTIGAGLAGLVITYSFQITGRLNWLVRMATESEVGSRRDLPCTFSPAAYYYV